MIIEPQPIECDVEIWQHPKLQAWKMVTFDEDVSDEIRFQCGPAPRPWGFVMVQVTLGMTTWTSMLFPKKGTDLFELPIKAAVRKKENVDVGDRITLTVLVQS